MKKRQLLIYMLAGSLVFTSVPMTAAAEETFNAVSETMSDNDGNEGISVLEASDETAAGDVVKTITESPMETPAEVVTEAPTEEPAEIPEETPTESPTEIPEETPTEAPAENPTQTPAETPIETPAETPSAVPTEIPSDDFSAPSESGTNEGQMNVIIIPETVSSQSAAEGAAAETESAYPFYIGDEPFETLTEAIGAVADSESTDIACTQIIIKAAELNLSETVVIPEHKNICLVAGVETVTISRADGFTGELFHVKGDGVLHLATGEIVKEDGSETISKLVIDGAVSDETACGRLIFVEAGVLGIGENVELKNNYTAENGSAIYNAPEGKIYLIGGTISGNKTDASGAGIYSEGVLFMEGSPVVSGNTNADGLDNNIVLNGTSAGIIVTGAFDEDAEIGVQVTKATEGTKVINILQQAEDVTMEDVLAVITYEGEEYVLDENGALKAEETEEPEEPENPGEDDRTPYLYEADQSTISGLAEAKYFYPASERNGNYTYYDFTVEGAGTGNEDPIAGDIKWEPVYWSYKKSPSDSEKNTTWTLGTESGISGAGTQKIYVFFDKYEYDGSAWKAVNVTEAVGYEYESLALFYLTGVSCTWRSQTEADVTFRTNKAAKYYVEAVVRGSTQPSPVGSNFIDMASDTDLTITVGDLDVDTEYDIYVYAIDKDGGIVSGMKFQPKESTRPSAPTTREPYTPAVTESVVTGLENPLQFYPNTFYSFTVKGAGTDNTDPVEGDEKWVPVYWSTSSNPSNSQKHTTWKIGAAAGISQAATYNMYVFYQKYYYNGTKWVVTDTVKSVAYQFKSAEIEITVTPDDTNNSSGGYYDEDGNYISGSGSDAQEQDGTTTDTGAVTSTGAVNTADDAPVGSLFAMMAAALSAMCCTITRKRKKMNKR